MQIKNKLILKILVVLLEENQLLIQPNVIIGKNMKTVEILSENKMKIKMFNLQKEDFFNTLDIVKSCIGRYYDNINRQWIIPINSENIKKLKSADFQIPENIIHPTSNTKPKETNKKMNILLKPDFNNKLFNFQKKGVQFAEAKNGRCLIADEMGLGKTIQSLAYINIHPEFKKILIVCPASLKLNWQNEIKKWLDEESQILRSKTDAKTKNSLVSIIDKKIKINIINYDILTKFETDLVKTEFDLIVFDECHYCKNKKAQRTVSALKIAKSTKHIIALSGTPILNRPIEFWNILNLLCPETFTNWWQYIQRYCSPEFNGFGWNYKGASNTEELNNILIETVMIRRTKNEVLKDLPSKLKSVIPIEINNRKEYQFASNNFEDWLQTTEKKSITMEALAKIEKLKQLSAKGKLDTIVEWIENFIEENGKLVIMATHHFVIDHLMDYFSKTAVKLDGRDSMEKKQKAVEAFQTNEKIKLFVGNIKAAGVGITLTAASSLCFCEFGWAPGEMVQAEDRIHRIGQKECCNIYYFVGQDTIDEDIIDLLDSKQQVLDSVLDGIKTQEESLLKALLKKYKGE